MTEKNSEIIVLMDGSGSMNEILNDVIGGFNGFIENQKAEPGKAKITFIQFNAGGRRLFVEEGVWYTKILDNIDLNECPKLTKENYKPGGGTALLDAIGKTIIDIEDRFLDNIEKIPDNVIFVVMTDGEENSSRKYNKDAIKKMIEHQKVRHGWNFIFLGADQDAFAEASGIGISRGDTFSFAKNARGVAAAYGDMNASTVAYRK